MKYGDRAYAGRHEETWYAARRVVELVLGALPGATTSAVDVGCGIGSWLRALSERGVAETRGYDGPWVGKRHLVISPGSFRRADLERLTAEDVGRRFDLALSLEVAEHLPKARAEGFVGLLCDLSDVVLFSAAVPGQGGVGHQNEQWPAYWAALFARRGYEVHDVIRPSIWDDRQIPFWYRQNTVLYAKRALPPPTGGYASGWGSPGGAPPALVHPDLWELRRQGVLARVAGRIRKALGDHRGGADA